MDYKRAKEMFFIYYGSKGYMWRGEVLEEYESYHVPEWLEIEWQKEIMIDLKNKMELDLPQKEKWGVINCYLTCNQNFYKKDSIDFLEKHKEEIIKMDDCSKLLVIESIFDHSLPKEKEKRKKIIEKCIKKLRKMFEKEAKKEFTIDKSYYEPYKLSDTFVDDEIKERIKTYIWLFLFEGFYDNCDFERLLILEEVFDYLPINIQTNYFREKKIDECIKELKKKQEKISKKQFTINEKYYVNGILPDDLSSKELKKRIKNVLHKYQLAKKEL